MRRQHGWIALAMLAMCVAGCRGSQEPGEAPASAAEEQSSAQLEGPAAAVHEFLEAVRAGDDDKVVRMLTTTAREKSAEMNLVTAFPASDTAEFTVGQVQYLAADGARVACTWSDLDENSRRKNDEVLWILRREPSGWRIAGMAMTVFEGEPPLLLNFEDPEEVLRKRRLVREEAIRRARQGRSRAQKMASPENSVRR